MSGSSRSLVRALEAVFAEKETSKIPDADLSTTINEYLVKHNNFTTIKQSSYNIHEELYRIYNGYIKPSHKLERENRFLDVLIQVCDVFSDNEVNLWISTYLKSAIDSAGYELTFVANSKKFIEKVLTNYSITECDRLNDLHEKVSITLAQQLLDIYLNEDTVTLKLKLDVGEEQRESQAYHERIRFIRSNCAKLLLEYGQKYTNQYCNLLNQYMQNVDYRLEAIVLLGYLINSDIRDTSIVVENDIFQNLLKCLHFDLEPNIVHCALNNLFILIPKVVDKLGRHLSDILLIYLRITSWSNTNEAVSKEDNCLANEFVQCVESWQVALPRSPEFNVVVGFNYQYLCTLLYGLFYFNFAAFVCDPLDYLTAHAPSVVSIGSLKESNFTLSNRDSPLTRAMTITKQLLGAFLVHPKYWMKDDQVDELNHPTGWLPGDASLEEIAIACLSLNPNILIRNGEASTPIQSSNVVSTVGDPLSRSSSLAGPMYFQANGPAKQLMKSRLLQHRKMSIIPTHLVLDNNHSNGVEDEIKFKEFGFTNGQESQVSEASSATSPSSSKQDRHDPVNDLLYDHARLFTTVKHNRLYHQSNFPVRTNSLDPITAIVEQPNEKSKQEMRLGRPMSSPTTNLEASSVFKDNSTTTTGTNGDASSLHSSTNDPPQSNLNELNANGTIIDFYQRELLLFKNELEFSSYMKHLNKFHYLKVKDEASEDDDNVRSIPIQRNEENAFVKMIDNIKNEWEGKQQDFNRQYDLLTAKIKQLESEKENLSMQLLTLRQSTETNVKEYDELVKSVIPNKDYEIEQLKLKLKTSELEEQKLHTNTYEHTNNATTGTIKELMTTQKSLEDQIYNYKMEHQVLNQQIVQLEQENKELQTRFNSMISQYEAKLEKSKLSLSETLASLTTPFEKKITELQAVIHKYQTLLEEQTRNKLTSSSSGASGTGSVPIPIIRQNSSNSSGDYSFGHDNSHGNNTMPSRSMAPIQQMVRNGSGKISTGLNNANDGDSLPLMRGRGGLQKKTRKFM
ncbi:hypothetical protein CORT_0B05400 [Candida orthopsilosis Co 90-125]|uniref:Growth arrest-specific protein 8 domain-containing protein n=1 Tax=Candida orthopsilosis (strain 90-125) TaxID=1136231 RepID=H8WZQ3_CANO9|nr:hypothetical protein CORT_0B05400 [Candida orthopsilosis Co 90-125]CCG22248.1 hypothetical protein CORT_0B05400 [Candida orthopsilosis Co 90-125]